MPTVWAQNLSRIIDKKRVKKGELARAADIDPATLSQILNQDYEPGASILMRLAKALDVDAGELLQDPEHGAVAETLNRPAERAPRIDWLSLLHKIALDIEEAIEVAERAARDEAGRSGTDESPGTRTG